MKRQGKYGFTWDSKAEEWAAWCVSVLEHDKPKRGAELGRIALMWSQYMADCRGDPKPFLDLHDDDRRNPDPYRAIIWRDEPRKAPLWPFAAIAVVAAVAAAVLWGWG